jgi:hypothetical protein
LGAGAATGAAAGAEVFTPGSMASLEGAVADVSTPGSSESAGGGAGVCATAAPANNNIAMKSSLFM